MNLQSQALNKVIPIRIKGQSLLFVLLFGGFITLMEVTNRATILGSFSIDALRNLILVQVAFMSVMFLPLSRNATISNPKILWPYLLFVGWGIFSISWSIDLTYSIRDLLNLLYPILIYILAATYTRTNEDRKTLFLQIISILRFFALLSLLMSVIFIFTQMRSGLWQWGESRLLDVPFSLSPVVAPVYVLLELAGYQKIPGWRPRWWLVSWVSIYILLTLTRAYIIAFAFAIAVLFWMSRRRLHWRVFIVMLGFACIFALFTVDNPLKTRMFLFPDEVTASTIINLLVTEPTTLVSSDFIRFSGRLSFWEYTLDASQEVRPAFIGAGLGSSRKIMIDSPFAETVAHSDFIKYLAELGYLGFVLYLMCYITLFFWSLKIVSTKYHSALAQTAATTLTGISILSFVIALAYNPFIHAHTLLAITMYLVVIIHSEKIYFKGLRHS